MGDRGESKGNLCHRLCKKCGKIHRHPPKSRNIRDPSPDGDAPLYPNDPEPECNPADPNPDGDAPIFPLYPEDPEPKCNPADCDQTSPGECKDQILLYLVVGYILGILLVLIWYCWNPKRASTDLGGTWFFIVLFFLSLLILTQRRSARCIALLCLPTLAHYQSRAVFVTLAFLFALSGPVMNIICNIDVMAYSLNCQQNQLIDALGCMHSILSDPVLLVEDLFRRTVAEVFEMTAKLDKIFEKLENPMADIYATFGQGAGWLALQNEHFEYRMGSPYTRCLRAGNLSIFQYQTEFGKQATECNPQLFAWFCESLRGRKGFFHNYLPVQPMIIANIVQRLRISFLKIRLMFLATISFDHSGRPSPSLFSTDKDFIYNPEATRSKFNFIAFWLYLILFLLLLTVILESIDFRVRYLSSEHFDNVYITDEFEVYEEQQSQIMGVRVLPLSSWEEDKYAKIASPKLLAGERTAMCHSVAFLLITGIQLYCLCLVDYSLYRMLVLMQQHGNMTADVQPSPYRKMVITGGGQIGYFVQGLVHAFEPKAFQVDSSKSCLPVPEKPKYFRYFWISVLYALAWIMVLWEPYGLRQRHRIMAYFHPKESCRRVQYLHYGILKERKSQFQLSCQRARFLNCYLYDSKIVSCISSLSSLTSWFFGGCPGVFIGRSCIICSKPLTKSDHVFCDSPNCSGVYCNVCFNEFHNICILCSPPPECAFSEIGDSSDELEYNNCFPEDIESH